MFRMYCLYNPKLSYGGSSGGTLAWNKLKCCPVFGRRIEWQRITTSTFDAHKELQRVMIMSIGVTYRYRAHVRAIKCINWLTLSTQPSSAAQDPLDSSTIPDRLYYISEVPTKQVSRTWNDKTKRAADPAADANANQTCHNMINLPCFLLPPLPLLCWTNTYVSSWRCHAIIRLVARKPLCLGASVDHRLRIRLMMAARNMIRIKIKKSNKRLLPMPIIQQFEALKEAGEQKVQLALQASSALS